MEKVLKGYKFRMYPNNEQKILIEKSFGCSRYIYNYFLNLSKEKTSIKAFDYIKELPKLIEENEWLKEVDSCLLRTSIFDLENAYQKHCQRKDGKRHIYTPLRYYVYYNIYGKACQYFLL